MTQTSEPGSRPVADYKKTVLTPQTDFSMRANAAVREPEIQRFWEDHGIYRHQAADGSGEVFILHDGPPYANGDLHTGHALNKILKDTINRYQILHGRCVRYVPGWDCHGLPIEIKVLQEMSSKERAGLAPLALRRKARDFALATIDKQRAAFRRYGVWGDWSEPYITLQPEYEAAQIGVFGRMALRGYIYRGLKPVHWSPSSRTALAEAELEYPENEDGSPAHVSRSVYVRFPVRSIAQPVAATVIAAELLPFLSEYRDREEELLEVMLGERDELPPLSVAIWTTTPWTLPGNLAIALGSNLDYAVVRSQAHGFLLVAEALMESLADALGTEFELVTVLKGSELEGSVCLHPLYDRPSPLVLGSHVTTESGTGAVHTAPGHGAEDFDVAQHYGLAILSPVDDGGNFTSEADEGRRFPEPVFASKSVLGDGNGAVIEALTTAGALLAEVPYRHKYPYDWRTKQPTIFRATTQWFASVAAFRAEALDAIARVKWIPASGENRITAMVADRSDWCISRQRAWGLPIPAFYCTSCGQVLLTEQSIGAVQAAIRIHGSDIWWEKEAHDLLPGGTTCNHCGGNAFRKETDIMDVWFDSGSSWAAVLEQRPGLHVPADVCLEGSDQHRGWFQSSLLTCIATEGRAPYRSVLTHGFVLDEKGRKMSKSLGNTVDPKLVIEGGKDQKRQPAYGADVLRLWVSSVDYTSDMLLGPNILAQTAEVYRKIRNTARFLLGNLHDFLPSRDLVAYQALEEVDLYALHRLKVVTDEVSQAFETYQFSRFFQAIQHYCVVELSNFYLDISKDRLYIAAADSPRRRTCQTVLYHALEGLTRMIAPVLPHLAEDIWQHLPYPVAQRSVFEARWPESTDLWYQPELAGRWQALILLRDRVNVALESARSAKQIGSSLEARLELRLADPAVRAEAERLRAELRYLFLVSEVVLIDEPSSEAVPEILVLKAEGQKCERCWNYSIQVGEFADHPTLCERCEPVVT